MIQASLFSRRRGAATLAAVGFLGLAALLPGVARAGVAGPVDTSPTALCPQPALADTTTGSTTTYAVTADSQPGEPPALGAHVGQKGSWVTVNGSNFRAYGCITTVYVGGVQQTSPPPKDASNPVPPPTTSTQLTFQSTGDSGPVTVVLTPQGFSGSNVSNNNYTFLAQPQVSGFSTLAPAEQDPVGVSGSGFALGGLPSMVEATFFDRSTSGGACGATAGSVNSDELISIVAPAAYCAGPVAIALTAPYNTTLPSSAPENRGNSVRLGGTEGFAIRTAGVLTAITPSNPRAGSQVTISGSGFGPSGAALLSGQTLPVTAWSDRSITASIPSSATSGPLELFRSDGSHFNGGTLGVLTVAGGPLPLGTITLPAPSAQSAPTSAPAATTRPQGSTVNAPPSPVSSARASGPASTPYATTPVSLAAFRAVAIVVAIGAILFALLRMTLYLMAARRGTRTSGSVRVTLRTVAAGAIASPFRRRTSELRLGRYVGKIEVVGRATPLGHLLLREGIVDRRALSDSLQQQRDDGRPLGEVLVSRGIASEEAVWSTLGQQWGISLGDLDIHWIDSELAQSISAVDSIRHRMLVVRRIGTRVVMAMADPFDARARHLAEDALGLQVVPILATPGAIRRRQEQVYSASLLEESVALLRREQPDASAHTLTTRPQRVAAAVSGFVLLLLAIIFGGRFFIGVAGAVIALYALVVIFRAYVIFRGAKFQDVIKVSQAELDALDNLPVYTILCPLYREAGVLPQLVTACAALDYPSSLLDVKLLLEADDTETLEAVATYPLPPYFDVVVVPAEGPRTKPKACNYGLQFARGEYVVIFDAEDIPEPDQLKKAIATFRRSGDDVGCVQAKLNFYNPRQNVLTSWFALEYTAWFDFFLPGLVELGMPVPLGGSSNHFRTDLLRQLNAWDPDNVTEDADLGMRLHRAGYHTVMVESTTFEEANSDFVNWVKQRSRWGKGYAVSWLVQMRHPRTLFRELGWRNFLAVQLTLGGTFGVAVLNLLVWMLTLLWILAQFDFIAYLFPSAIYYVGMIELLLGNFFFLYMGVWSCQHRKSWELTRVALLAPLYWLMMSLAMLKASLQLVTKPNYWEKTVHGLFEHASVAADVPADGLVGNVPGVASATEAAVSDAEAAAEVTSRT